MENPRPEKVAVVDDVRARFESTSAALLTEYRGLDVAAISELRRALRSAGGEYKIYKNNLVRFAARDLGLELEELLTGPTAIAFITERPDGTPGDAVDVAKALRDFARANPSLVVKGGVLGTQPLSADAARALADVEPREVLLAKLAGALAAPMVQLAGLLEALPRNLAYGLAALIDKQGGVPETPDAEPARAETGASATLEADASQAPAADAAPAETTEPLAEEAPAEEPATEAGTTDDTTSATEQAPTEEPVADDTTTEE